MRKFNSSLHPRGGGGRFTTKGGKSSGSARRTELKRLTGKQRARLEQTLEARSRDKRKAFSVAIPGQTARQKLYLERLTPAQQAKLKEIKKAKTEAKITLEAKVAEVKSKRSTAEPKLEPKPRKPRVPKAKVTPAPDEPTGTTDTKAAKTPKDPADNPAKKPPRLPTARPPADISNVEFSDKGIEVWKDNDLRKPRDGFKVQTDRNFIFSADLDGGDKVVLNRHQNVFELDGERVMGVPHLHPKLKESSDQTLFDSLARCMSYVEGKSKGVEPPAPDWKPTFHGKVDKQHLAARGYGQMQIHHIDQWAQRAFKGITDAVDDGRMTLDEAKAEMRKLLRPVTKTTKSGAVKQGWEINIQEVKDRRLVVLAGGTHDFTSPLYSRLHPIGINPDTGKREEFGIPKTGEGGREPWFTNFRNKLWTEYYRRETFVLRQELSTRIAKGDLTKEQAETCWKEAHRKVDDSYNKALDLRKARELEKQQGSPA